MMIVSLSLSFMKSCRSSLCVLLLLTISAESESAVPTVKVKLHDSAVLPCSERCPGLVRWSITHKRSDVLAECDQTSCRSVKEGYQMIHDQYLKGDLSLTITGADFSKRALYTCECDDRDLCDVRLQIEALKTSVQVQPGESLLLHLDVSDPVELVYSSSGQICTVEGGSLQCRSEYSQRTSLSSVLELRGVEESDSGVYTVRTIRTKEDIHIYTVSIRDVQPVWKSEYQQGFLHGAASVGSVMLVLGALLAWFVLPWVFYQIRKVVLRLRNRDPSNRKCDGNTDNENGAVPLKDTVDPMAYV
ncbi:uncharacterized protein [Salminus brasiliensis]